MKRFIKSAAVFAICGLLVCGAAFADSSWKLAGTWNYSSTVPSQAVTLSGDTVYYSSSETGTIDLNMTAQSDGEYFNSYTCTYKGTNTVRSQYGTDSKDYSGGPYTQALEATKYTPGNETTFTQTIQIRGYNVNEKLVLKQVEENKLTGKVYLTLEGQTISGDVTATRNSGGSSGSGGGGCNAGATAAMLMFCVAPMVLRKKHKSK